MLYMGGYKALCLTLGFSSAGTPSLFSIFYPQAWCLLTTSHLHYLHKTYHFRHVCKNRHLLHCSRRLLQRCSSAGSRYIPPVFHRFSSLTSIIDAYLEVRGHAHGHHGVHMRSIVEARKLKLATGPRVHQPSPPGTPIPDSPTLPVGSYPIVGHHRRDVEARKLKLATGPRVHQPSPPGTPIPDSPTLPVGSYPIVGHHRRDVEARKLKLATGPRVHQPSPPGTPIPDSPTLPVGSYPIVGHH